MISKALFLLQPDRDYSLQSLAKPQAAYEDPGVLDLSSAKEYCGNYPQTISLHCFFYARSLRGSGHTGLKTE